MGGVTVGLKEVERKHDKLNKVYLYCYSYIIHNIIIMSLADL